MSGIIVQPDFIKKLQPFTCGEGVYRKDAPHCAEKPQAIDLDRYENVGKYADIIPWYTSDEVQFCSAYTELYRQSNQFCMETPEEAIRGLEALIEKGPSKDEKLPTYSQVYAMLAKPQPGITGEQYRRLRSYLVAKSKRIATGLAEIEELRKQDKPAELEERKVALLQDIRQTCIEDNPDSLRQLNDACTNAIDTHKTVKTWQKWIGTALVTLAGGIFAFFKSGRAARSIEAWKAEWKASGKAGKKWYNPMRWLSSLDAFIRAKNDIPVDQQATPSQPGDPTAPPPIPPDGVPTPGQPLIPTDVSPVDGTAPAAYTLKQDADATHIAWEIDKALLLVAAATRALQAPGAHSARMIKTLSDQPDADALARLQRLAPILRSEGMQTLYQRLAVAFEKQLLDNIVPDAIMSVADVLKPGQSDAAKTRQRLSTAAKAAKRLAEKRGALDAAISKLRHVEQDLRRIVNLPKDGSAARIQETIITVQAIVQDGAALLHAVIGVLDVDEEKDVQATLDYLQTSRFNTSTVEALVASVLFLSGSEAARRKVTLLSGEIPSDVPISDRIRRDLFRVLFEAVRNGIKYSDNKKSMRTVSVTFETDEASGDRTFVVEDNGVGMTPEEVEEVISTPSKRLRPELAIGTGDGVTSIILGLAIENGWEVHYEPRENKGVKVRILIPAARWGNGTPSTPASGGGSGPKGTTPDGKPGATTAPAPGTTTATGSEFGKVEIVQADPTQATSTESEEMGTLPDAAVGMFPAGPLAPATTGVMQGLQGASAMMGIVPLVPTFAH